MYLSKPEGGFCIPVLYINKDELNISRFKDINKEWEDKKIDYLRYDAEDRYSENNIDLEVKDENYNISEDERNNCLIFDVDECESGEEIKKSIIDRRINEVEAESVGVLILDGEDVEDSNYSD